MLTLQELKKRPINQRTVDMFRRTYELSTHNICVLRYWLYEDEDGPKRCAHEITHNGNDRKPSKQLLDDARIYIEKNVYTDEEWEKYFIPAINAILDYNANFERWFPGYLVKDKRSGQLYIVEYDYAVAFGQGFPYECTDYQNLYLCELDDKGNVTGTCAWRDYDNYVLVDKNHAEDNIAKVRKYHARHKHTPPYHMRSDIMNLYY